MRFIRAARVAAEFSGRLRKKSTLSSKCLISLSKRSFSSFFSDDHATLVLLFGAAARLTSSEDNAPSVTAADARLRFLLLAEPDDDETPFVAFSP